MMMMDEFEIRDPMTKLYEAHPRHIIKLLSKKLITKK